MNVNVLDILAGNIPKEIPEIRPLFEVIKAAEGRTDYDAPLLRVLAQQPAPGDAVLDSPGVLSAVGAAKIPFGIPDNDDPDPFGVIALEMAGLEIREAGTRARPTSNQFEYSPAPSSPLVRPLQPPERRHIPDQEQPGQLCLNQDPGYCRDRHGHSNRLHR